MINRVILSTILVISALLGCSKPIQPPVCRTNIDHESLSAAPLFCVIPQQNKLVFLQKKGQLPDTVSVVNSGPNAMCKLHEQVWQKTGINVDVDQLLFSTANANMVSCLLSNDIVVPDQGLALPTWRQDNQAASLELRNPFELTREDIANPHLLIPLREAFVAHQQNNKKED